MERGLVDFERRVLDPFLTTHITHPCLNAGCGDDTRGDTRLDMYKTPATTVIGDICKLPFPDKSFDTVMVVGVLHHLPSYTRALKEVTRVSSRYIIGREPNILHPHLCTIRHFIGMEGECPLYIPKLKRELEHEGFRLVKEQWDYGLKLLGTVTGKHDFLMKFDPIIPIPFRAFWSYVYERV